MTDLSVFAGGRRVRIASDSVDEARRFEDGGNG